MLRFLMHFTIWNRLDNLHIMLFPCHQKMTGLFRLDENKLGVILAHDIPFHIWNRLHQAAASYSSLFR
jgi:hypothetical protein